MSGIQAYLASKYMSGAKADAILSRSEDQKPKKKKRKGDKLAPTIVGEGTGLLIADEDSVANWDATVDDAEEDVPVVTNAPKAFKKTKANWSVPGSTLTPDEEEDEKPQIAETSRSVSPPPVVKKKKGGLLTAAQVREEAEALAAEERRKDAERERERRAAREERIRNGEEEEEDGDDQDRPDHQRTVYRDRSGKIVDMKKQREEELKQERDARAREEAKKDWGKGLVQRNEQAQVARRVQEAAGTSFARSANDRNMNEGMREEVRWNDPAAAFLTKTKKKGPRRPKCPHAGAPNRFGILPGFRWDGVDRSTGYEAKLFQKINDRKRLRQEAHAWGTEDM